MPDALLAWLNMPGSVAHQDSAQQHELVYSQNNSCTIAYHFQTALNALTAGAYNLYSNSSSASFLSSQH